MSDLFYIRCCLPHHPYLKFYHPLVFLTCRVGITHSIIWFQQQHCPSQSAPSADTLSLISSHKQATNKTAHTELEQYCQHSLGSSLDMYASSPRFFNFGTHFYLTKERKAILLNCVLIELNLLQLNASSRPSFAPWITLDFPFANASDVSYRANIWSRRLITEAGDTCPGTLLLGLPVGVLCFMKLDHSLHASDVGRVLTILRVPDQNGVSQAWYIVEIYHSGLEALKL